MKEGSTGFEISRLWGAVLRLSMAFVLAVGLLPAAAFAGASKAFASDTATAFAERLYTAILDREADPDGLATQVWALNNGWQPAEIAYNFFGSEEFEGRGLSRYWAVATAYEAILGREGSEEEILWWVQSTYDNCYSVTDVVLHFANSDEFNGICAEYGLTSGMRGPGAATLPTPGGHAWNGDTCAHCGYSDDPKRMDSDGDGIPDYVEVEFMGTDPYALTDLANGDMPEPAIIGAEGTVFADADSVEKSEGGDHVVATFGELPEDLAEGCVLAINNGDAAIRVDSIVRQPDGTYAVEGDQVGLDEVADYMCIEDDLVPLLDQAVAAEGFEVRVEDLTESDLAALYGDDVSSLSVSASGEASLGGQKLSITPVGTVKLGSHGSVEFSNEIQIVFDSVHMQTLTAFGVPYGANIGVKGRVVLNGLKIKGQVKFTSDDDCLINLAHIPVAGALGCGGFIDVYGEVTLSGEVSIGWSYNYDLSCNVTPNDVSSPRMKLSNFGTPDVTFKAEAMFGVKVQPCAELLGVKLLTVYGTAGVKGNASRKAGLDCIDLKAWVFSETGASLGFDSVKWATVKGKIEIWNASSSPIKLSFHLEDGKFVDKCTKTGNSDGDGGGESGESGGTDPNPGTGDDAGNAPYLSSDVSVGDYVTFGCYEQDEIVSNDITPIEWRVLAVEGGKALLVSRYGLDARPYNEVNEDVTWATCSLRSWLNADFFETAFSADERVRIALTHNVNLGNPEFGTAGGADTDDRVFLLSIDEVDRYFDNVKTDPEGNWYMLDRVCVPTRYAVAMNAVTNTFPWLDGDYACIWWLRSPGEKASHAANVFGYGDFNTEGYFAFDQSIVVRPAIWVNL